MLCQYFSKYATVHTVKNLILLIFVIILSSQAYSFKLDLLVDNKRVDNKIIEGWQPYFGLNLGYNYNENMDRVSDVYLALGIYNHNDGNVEADVMNYGIGIGTLSDRELYLWLEGGVINPSIHLNNDTGDLASSKLRRSYFAFGLRFYFNDVFFLSGSYSLDWKLSKYSGDFLGDRGSSYSFGGGLSLF